MTVDFRTRRDADIVDVEIDAFFTATLPLLLAESAKLVLPWLHYRNPDDLTLECEGSCWQLCWREAAYQTVSQ